MTVLLILSSLALLAATVCICIVAHEKRRNQERNTAFQRRLEALEKGAVPDFEKAKDAAKAMDEFNAGISGILGYDPFDALRAQRDKAHGGEEQ